MKARASSVAALATAALALAGGAAQDGNLLGDTNSNLVSIRSISKFTIVNNTTTPGDAAAAAGTLLYNCGGTLPLLTLAKDDSVDLDCTSASILYQVPGEVGPHRLDFSCDADQRERLTFTGSGSGVASQASCGSSTD